MRWEEARFCSQGYEVWQTRNKAGDDGVLIRPEGSLEANYGKAVTFGLGWVREGYWGHAVPDHCHSVLLGTVISINIISTHKTFPSKISH